MFEIILGILLGVVLTALYFVKKKPVLDSKKLEHLENSNTTLQYEIKSLHERLGGFENVLGTKEQELEQVKEQASVLKNQLDQEIERNRTILSQKKSSEIRTGHIAETLAPFLMGNHDPKRLRWLGQPVDYIAFDKDGITFIEVKSGKSHLSHNQKYVKQLVLDKKVYWKEFRIRGKNEHRKFKPRNPGFKPDPEK